ncbi:MAG TPA: phenylalanine--tRNA ligase subunit alpha [Candidatus Hydrogenedens sp.]|nr:phenylalanine--tRNA ligase subunit alpha [Candidatus Hydrogenedens sp.]HOL20981.1 phenylalanine--tRNA ligase subunit alpha [Candidatus Hydrogenedens sp.]HPP58317.1 phenylalanine--tRNA ligase subunit alpha [Candidatus Hydrogenedens sp.]
MINELEQVKATALQKIKTADSTEALEQIRVEFLGKKGKITEVLKQLGSIPPEERPKIGSVANEVKKILTEAIENQHNVLLEKELQRKIEQEQIDITLPGRTIGRGHMHVINQVMNEIVGIFVQMGFQVASGPEVETEYYNFESLNTPEDHPARDVHDTFYVKKGVVLRTHTSPVQMRVMEKTKPPVAVVVPGRVYRVDNDASHSPMFNQMEGLLVDEDITFADLKGSLMYFVRKFFGEDTAVRFRPHYFPFTEPSAEMDISCTVCKGKGCRVCKNSGWLEILGCGMVHPKVFEYAGYDNEKYQGYAFGFGIDRMAMLKYAIPSINLLFDNNLKVLEQF